jgi:hypothetical protein
MVDIPFVSENFQRSYRNRFPSQTSTGRDLHVSDVVIPVVDFTPTASGTSLPRDLQEAMDYTTTAVSISGDTELTSNTGFYKLNFSYTGDITSDEAFSIFLKEISSGTNYSVFISGSTIIGSTSTYQQTTIIDFYVFIPVGYTLRANASGNHNGRVQLKQIGDVNGNLTLPTGYSPQ